MRIALLAHLRHPIAPPFAGGLEAYTWHLAEGLTARGHAIALFASGDSDRRFTLDPVIPVHHEAAFPGMEHRGDAGLKAHVDAGYAAALDRIAAGGFDVLHNNSLSRLPLERRRLEAVPTVTSLHVPPYDALRWFVHESLMPGHRITATSQAHARSWWPDGVPQDVTALHNGIDPAAWPFRETGDGSAVWCGRIAAVKGPHHAVAAARRAGLPLTLFGPIEEPDYWRAHVAPVSAARSATAAITTVRYLPVRSAAPPSSCSRRAGTSRSGWWPSRRWPAACPWRASRGGRPRRSSARPDASCLPETKWPSRARAARR